MKIESDPLGDRLRDVWAAGDAYEPYVGRWSRVVAREFLTWLGDATAGTTVDVGCGTGALTQTLLSASADARVNAIDASFGFLSYARAHTRDARATFTVADARALPFRDGHADAAVSALVLNFVPSPGAALSEMTRVVRRGGVVATYLWDYAAGMEMIRQFWQVAASLDSSAAELDEARRFPLCEPTALVSLWDNAGLQSVASRAIDVPTRFTNFDDYWNPFLGGQGPAPTFVKQLGNEARAKLRERLKTTLPTAPDGSISLRARAWAVRGTRA